MPAVLVAVVLAVVLLAGSAFAAYTVLTLNTEVTVGEPLLIEYNLQGLYGGDALWHELGDEDSLTLERLAGSTFVMDLQITSEADNALTVNAVFTGDVDHFTKSGPWPDNTPGNVPGETTTLFDDVTLDVNGDTPPDVYSLTISFTRE